jgi:hypothetical protein
MKISDGDTRLIRPIYYSNVNGKGQLNEPKEYTCLFCNKQITTWGHVPACHQKRKQKGKEL